VIGNLYFSHLYTHAGTQAAPCSCSSVWPRCSPFCTGILVPNPIPRSLRHPDGAGQVGLDPDTIPTTRFFIGLSLYEQWIEMDPSTRPAARSCSLERPQVLIGSWPEAASGAAGGRGADG
jgi:hypothetical protein